ncbi:hypothetical protein [Ruegeria atlantica]|uniref:hypothetical protein n=1 Tax=Ruegeria atlantica TaxID=81569 RepID=UPI00147F992E|nr:hypothetical protein [Ruegeria atlantica]
MRKAAIVLVSLILFPCVSSAKGGIEDFYSEKLRPKLLKAGAIELQCEVQTKCLDDFCEAVSIEGELMVYATDLDQGLNAISSSEVVTSNALLFLEGNLYDLEGAGNKDHFWGIEASGEAYEWRSSFTVSLKGGPASLTTQNVRTFLTTTHFGNCEVIN